MDIDFAAIEGRSTGYRVAVAVMALLALSGVLATWGLIENGLYLTGMTNRIPWGIQMTMSVFYIGLAAGSLVVSALYGVFGLVRYRPFERVAVFMALLFLMAGLMSIATDQGRMDRFVVEPFTHFNPHSLFSINPILYIGHILGCVIYLYALFAARPRMAKVTAVAVVCWAFALHTDTGMILGFIPRELHQSPLLAPTFIVAAIASGTACMILVIATLRRMTGRFVDDRLILWLGRLLAIFVILVVYFLAAENMYRCYLVETRTAAQFYLFGGFHAVLFWFGLVLCGCVIPGAILLNPRTGRSVRWVVGAAALVVFGILCERYVIVIPGQTNPPHLFPGMVITDSLLEEGFVHYSIGFYEVLQVLGVFGIIGFLFLVGLKVLALAPTEARLSDGEAS